MSSILPPQSARKNDVDRTMQLLDKLDEEVVLLSAEQANSENGNVYLDNLELIELLKLHGLDTLLQP